MFERLTMPQCDAEYREDEGAVKANCGGEGYELPAANLEDGRRKLQEKLLDSDAEYCERGEHDGEPVCSGPWAADYDEA